MCLYTHQTKSIVKVFMYNKYLSQTHTISLSDSYRRKQQIPPFSPLPEVLQNLYMVEGSKGRVISQRILLLLISEFYSDYYISHVIGADNAG